MKGIPKPARRSKTTPESSSRTHSNDVPAKPLALLEMAMRIAAIAHEVTDFAATAQDHTQQEVSEGEQNDWMWLDSPLWGMRDTLALQAEQLGALAGKLLAMIPKTDTDSREWIASPWPRSI